MRTLATIFTLCILSAGLAVAADITGKWTANVVLNAGSGAPTLEFKQDGEKLTGSYHGTFGDAELSGTVKGNKVEFTFGNDTAKAVYTGTLEGGATKMSGTVDYGQLGTGTFTAQKN
jgi:hypothetical protein